MTDLTYRPNFLIAYQIAVLYMTRSENCISVNGESSLHALRVESIASPLHMLPNLISAPLFLKAHG